MLEAIDYKNQRPPDSRFLPVLLQYGDDEPEYTPRYRTHLTRVQEDLIINGNKEK